MASVITCNVLFNPQFWDRKLQSTIWRETNHQDFRSATPMCCVQGRALKLQYRKTPRKPPAVPLPQKLSYQNMKQRLAQRGPKVSSTRKGDWHHQVRFDHVRGTLSSHFIPSSQLVASSNRPRPQKMNATSTRRRNCLMQNYNSSNSKPFFSDSDLSTLRAQQVETHSNIPESHLPARTSDVPKPNLADPFSRKAKGNSPGASSGRSRLSVAEKKKPCSNEIRVKEQVVSPFISTNPSYSDNSESSLIKRTDRHVRYLLSKGNRHGQQAWSKVTKVWK